MKKLEKVNVADYLGCRSVELRINCCPMLQSIKLAPSQFEEKDLYIESLPSLEELVIGDWCCKNCGKLELISTLFPFLII